MLEKTSEWAEKQNRPFVKLTVLKSQKTYCSQWSKGLMKLCEAFSEAGSIEQYLEVILIWKKNSVQTSVSFHILLNSMYIYGVYICITAYMAICTVLY